MSTDKKNPQLYITYIGALCICLNLYNLYYQNVRGFTWHDLKMQWRTCAYTLRGIDVYLLRGNVNFLPEIGPISDGFHASPWGSFLGNVFYAGFIPYEYAKIYLVILYCIVTFTVAYLLYYKIKSFSFELGVTAFVLSVPSSQIILALKDGNAGGIICAFLVIACLICNEHPYISGILLAFAMVKPQVASLICLAFILLGHFRPVILAAVIDIAGWGVTSVLVKKGMLELLREFLFANGKGTSNPFPGIFAFATDNFFAALSASMIFGVIFVCVIMFCLPRGAPEKLKFYPAFMAVTFWSYSYTNDLYVLIVPALICLWLGIIKTRQVFWTLCGVFLAEEVFTRKVAEGIITAVLHTEAKSFFIARSLQGLTIIIIGVLMCFELRQIYREQ